MKLQARFFLAAVAGAGMALPAVAQEPGQLSPRLPSAAVAAASERNQEIAETIAARLRQDPILKQAKIDIVVQGGKVELVGNVASTMQRDHAQKIAMSAPGIVNVLDNLSIGGIQRVSGQDMLPPITEAPASQPMVAVPMPQPVAANGTAEPYGMAPVGGPVAPEMMGTPPLPSYSWPTYAPYNNLSRVGYPDAYPACAWPFIGPFYPFPRVPPGWRSVKLEWEDGHWWFSKTATKYDWWRIKYW